MAKENIKERIHRRWLVMIFKARRLALDVRG